MSSASHSLPMAVLNSNVLSQKFKKSTSVTLITRVLAVNIFFKIPRSWHVLSILYLILLLPLQYIPVCVKISHDIILDLPREKKHIQTPQTCS